MENKEQKNNKPKRAIILGVILGLVVLTGLLIYLRSQGFETTDNAQIEADIIPIRSSVSGYVKEVRFVDNQSVKKGDTLLIINDHEFKARVLQAEAALENARANLLAVQNNADAGGYNASAGFLTSETVAQNIEVAQTRLTKVKEDHSRIKNMFYAKAATKAEMDAIDAELAVAQAQLVAATSQYKASSAQSKGLKSQAIGQKSMVALAEALVKQRLAELDLAKTQLDYTVITAPCDGVVAKRSVDNGQFITMGSPVCTTIDYSSLWIIANFKETQIEHIFKNQEVEVQIDAYPSMLLTGKVDSYIGATGAKFSLLPPDNSTGNFVKIVQRVPVKIRLKGLNKKQRELLMPGLSAYVSVDVR